MSNNKVWFITGAGRGMGLDIAKAVLAAGHKLVATGRNNSSNELQSVCVPRIYRRNAVKYPE